MKFSTKSAWKNMRCFRFKSIFFQLYILTFCVSLLPLLGISCYNYYQNSQYLTEKTEAENQRYTTDLIHETQRQLDDLNTNVLFVTTNQETLSYTVFPKIDKDFKDIAKSTKYISNMMQMLVTGTNTVDSVYLYVESDNYVSGNREAGMLSNFSDTGWKLDYDKNKGKSTHWSAARTVVQNRKTMYLYTLGTMVFTEQKNVLGALILNLDMQQWSENLLPQLQEGGPHVYIVDAENNIIASNDKKALFASIEAIQPLLNDASYYLSQRTLSDYGWTFYVLTSQKIYLQQIAAIKQSFLLILVGGALGLLLIGWIVSMRVYQPIAETLELFNDDAVWLESNTVPVVQGNEYKRLKANIIKTMYHNACIEDELHYREQILDKMLSITLQLQISPHFLFNTLETINLLTLEKLGGDNVVSQMVVNLSRLLRMSLDTNEKFLSLDQEYDNLNAYVEIQQHHLYQELHVEFMLSPECSKVPILKMLLQPLVENAILHGIKPSQKEKHTICIQSHKVNQSMLQVDIIDDGVGLSESKLQEINQRLKTQTYIPTEEHIGLTNIQNRIRLVYGESYGVQLISNEHTGITSRIVIPFQYIQQF